MSTDTTTLKALAESYADKSHAADNAGKRMADHPDMPAHLATYVANRSKRGAANAVARVILGLPDDEPIKSGPAGAQKVTKNGRRIETVARWITRNAPADDTVKPAVLRATLSGKDGGSVVIEEGTDLYEQLVALIRDGKTD